MQQTMQKSAADNVQSDAQFVVGRFLIGIATVIIGSTVPMWIAEVASPKNRQVVSGLVLCSVPFAGVVVCWIVLGIYESESNWGWRSAILGEGFGPVLGTVLLFFVDESPRWLISKGQTEKVRSFGNIPNSAAHLSQAREILARLHGHGDAHQAIVEAEMREIVETLEYEKTCGGT